MQSQARVELRYAAEKTSLTPDHKTGTVSRVNADGSFSVSFDSYLFDNGKRVVKLRGGRYNYPASAERYFTVIA